jgi:hypothetical protein
MNKGTPVNMSEDLKPVQTIHWSDFKGKESILQKDMSRREPFTTTFLKSSDPSSIQNNIQTIQTLETANSQTVSKLMANYADISNNIQSYMTTQQYLHSNNPKYHYDDQLDPNVILKREPPNNINTVLEKDVNAMILYQNSVYISSAIACATLLIAAIIIVPLQKNS